jgi:hypothetical protein
MDNLFHLYRYLVQSQEDQNNPYNQALRTIESFLNILSELEVWGQHVIEDGGFQWEQADIVRDRTLEGCKTVLCAHFDNAQDAILEFALSHLPTSEYDDLIQALAAQKEREASELEEDNR